MSMPRGAVALVALLATSAGCAILKAGREPTPPPPVTTPVVIKTVPPRTPAPEGAAAVPTRPVKNPEAEKAKRAGIPIGPVVTYAGIARADGKRIEPTSVGAKGIPTFTNYVGSGFMIVIEGKPGISNLELARSVFRYNRDVPSASDRPDLQIQVDRPLGDGSKWVCDARRPKIGGIPAINPPSFAETEEISATLNDFACRFETFTESAMSCTVDEYGDFSFIKPDESTAQFCMVVARSWNFPMGDTLVSVRLRDTEGNPGPISGFRLRRETRPTPTPRPRYTPTPTISRRRP